MKIQSHKNKTPYQKPSKPGPGRRRNRTRLDAATARTETGRKTRWVRRPEAT